MHTLSVCMIVKNEEEVLSRCLASAVQFADEVVVVDTGSVDKTKEIARQYTEKVYDFAAGCFAQALQPLPFPKAPATISCGWMPTTS